MRWRQFICLSLKHEITMSQGYSMTHWAAVRDDARWWGKDVDRMLGQRFIYATSIAFLRQQHSRHTHAAVKKDV